MSGSLGGQDQLDPGLNGVAKAHDALRRLNAVVLEQWRTAMVDGDAKSVTEFVILAKSIRRADSLFQRQDV